MADDAILPAGIPEPSSLFNASAGSPRLLSKDRSRRAWRLAASWKAWVSSRTAVIGCYASGDGVVSVCNSVERWRRHRWGSPAAMAQHQPTAACAPVWRRERKQVLDQREWMSFREREKKAGFLADQHHRPVQSEAVEEAAQQRCSGTGRAKVVFRNIGTKQGALHRLY
jgi:hypothetical protein